MSVFGIVNSPTVDVLACLFSAHISEKWRCWVLACIFKFPQILKNHPPGDYQYTLPLVAYGNSPHICQKAV